VLCLLGAMGSGKSRVAEELARRGGRVISGDQLGHEALRQPDLRAHVVERWGPGVLDEHGEVSRRHLGAIVFGDPAERRALEELVFPWIGRRLREEVAAAQADCGVQFVVVDAAVLLEAGWDRSCDRIVYVNTPRAVRLQRLAGQRGWDEEELRARTRAQMSLTAKVSRADCVIDNSGSAEQLRCQIDALLEQLGLPAAG
jgi:dephospho-CoA kinase